jgi:hypothetical protein
MTTPYERFLESKAVSAPERGYIGNLNLNPDLKPHARDIAAWMIRGGNRACFASGRRGYGIELNEQYWKDSQSYCHAAECKVTMPTLFDMEPTEETPCAPSK